MNELKNLLVVKAPRTFSPEVMGQLRKALPLLSEQTGCEVVLVTDDMDATLHPAVPVVDRMDRLCDAIERMAETNQALIACLLQMDAGGNIDPNASTSLDG